MSCQSQKKLEATTEYFPISEDGPFNAIFNGLVWNIQFTVITLVAAFLIWSKFYIPILDKLKTGLRHGEYVTMVRGQIQDLTDEMSKVTDTLFGRGDSLKKWFFFDKEFLVNAVGETGYEYFAFQRFVIAYELVLTFVSLLIMLPIHLVVGSNFEQGQFAATTLANLSSGQHQFAYLHVVGSFLLLPLTLFTMKMFFRKIGKLSIGDEYAMRRTLYLTGSNFFYLLTYL